MKVACDRCLKIVSADSREVANDWLTITTDSGFKFLFCEKCADVFWETMFNCDAKRCRTVLLCKDCKHHYVNRDGNVAFNECELNHNHVQADDWYCADGERKEDEQDD